MKAGRISYLSAAVLSLVCMALGFWSWSHVRTLRRVEAENERLLKRVEWEKASSRSKDVYVAIITQVLNEVGERVEGMQEEKFDLSSQILASDLENRQLLREKTLLQRLQSLSDDARINDEQIDRLQSLLSLAGGNLVDLEAMAHRLRDRNSELEEDAARLLKRIVYLSRRVEHLQGTVEELQTEVAEQGEFITEQSEVIGEQDETLAQRQLELSREEHRKLLVYWTLGTRQELLKQGILQEEKRMFGLRKRRFLNSTPDLVRDHFLEAERNSMLEIVVGTAWRKIELLPLRPPASYSLRQQDGILEIVDPVLFWQSTFLVVIVFPKAGRD